MKQIELKDFLNYTFLSNVTVSPDGTSCVFTTTQCDEENNTYTTNLSMWKDGNTIQLTSSGKDTSPMYLDNQTILFKSSRDTKAQEKVKNGEEVSSYYTLSLLGGEAQKAFDLPLNVTKIEHIQGNLYIFSARYNQDYSIFGREDQKDALLKAKKENKDYEVFTKIPFCHNGAGYAKNTVNRVYLFNSESKEITPLTCDDNHVSTFTLNKDHSEVLIISHKLTNKPSRKMAVCTYHFESKEWTSLIKEDEMIVQGAHYFHDGILLIGNKELKHGQNENGRFYFINKNHEITLLNDNTLSTRNSLGSDCRYGGGKTSKVTGNKYYYTTTREKDGIIVSLDSKGQLQDELVLVGSIDCFDMHENDFFYVAMKDGKLQELYRNHEQLTHFNEEILKNKYIADYQEVQFNNDGVSLTGWVLLPKDYDPSKKYPAILDIHGGPKTAFGKVFYHEMQVWANMGYFVFFTNPRGSDGRDNEFMDIFGKYGTIDYDDLMKFTDIVLEKYPANDPKRVGVTGGSYGGFMTNWIIGHTDRFACAATQRSISNWISFYGTSDIGMFFAEDQIHGNIFNNPEKLWEHSPLKYADNIVTPTLFIHSDEDYRCPLEQGLQLYTAIVDKGVDTRFVLFHGENHELSRSGKPKHRVRRLEEITNWMEKYLK